MRHSDAIGVRYTKVKHLTKKTADLINRARQKIVAIQQALAALEYLCSGTLLKRMRVCGKPNCHCAKDPLSRHGPYYEWGHMLGGKLVHRPVRAEQAIVLQTAIDNHRRAKKLMREWEAQTERLIDLPPPPQP